jgi:NADH-quinone oxidoreductase subunit F
MNRKQAENQTKKIRNIADLKQIKAECLAEQAKYHRRLLLCSGAGCLSSNCQQVKEALLLELESKGLAKTIQLVTTGCIGSCDLGPVLVVLPEGILYTQLEPEDLPTLIQTQCIDGQVWPKKVYRDKFSGTAVPYVKDIPFFNEQVKIALRNCGSIDYSSLAEYITQDGYFGLAKALQMQPEEVVAEVKSSGLRGRGGGGFPAGIKWNAGLQAPGPEKYLVCNADEGDPGAFMDRSILEGDPHSVLEGMLIGGYAIGASRGYIYVRAEYPLAVERLEAAIRQLREAGLLGESILGSGFHFEIEIRIGAGAFVCGEETALMASIEGHRGEPRQKPPFPFQSGLFGKPTIINNVETLANIPPILLHGGEWFAAYGTTGSKGTKVFALAGDICNTGIVEVPMGKTLGDLIFKIGGGIPAAKRFKAAQTGGPSGGCITGEHLNTPVDYDSLVQLGTIMGSGGLIVMNEDTCMVDMARFFIEFVQDESCGKCVPCRLGSKRMLEILERITRGEGREADLDLLDELGHVMRESAICGLGQTAANPVLSTIKYFREEYEEHIYDKHCRAGVCGDLFISPCQNACPAGVNVPGYVALIAAGRLRDAYNLIRKENPFPAICGRVCTHPCESKCRRAQLDEAISICDLKRYVADYILQEDEPYLDLVFPKKGKRVAVVGAGPSGLTCAYYLARLGYETDVYESQSVAGGILAFGIPEYRLPKEVLAREIKMIEQVGVKIHLDTEIGKGIPFAKLRSDCDAVYVATGTQFSKQINVPGEELSGVYHGLNFLRDVNLGRPVKVPAIVAVIGGGNTAIDAARTALRLGAKEVTILYRRELEDMPADLREIRDAIAEGIKIMTLVAPVRICGDKCATTVECRRMELTEFDKDGRRKPKAIPGSEFSVTAELVIPAVSQYSDLPFIDKSEVELTDWGTFVTEKDTLMTRMKGVFAGGDVVRGSDVAITAIADGKNAARAIDRYLGGKGVLNTGEEMEIPAPSDEKELLEHERFPMRFLDPELRKKNFAEVAVGFHKLNAIAEAMRCLRCDRRS